MSSLNLKRRTQKHKRLALPVEIIQLLGCEVESANESENDIDAGKALIKLKTNT